MHNQPFIFSKHHKNTIVGVLDIVGSTELTAFLTGEQIDTFYTIFLEEISSLLRQFHAVPVKNMGDGILFYFPDHGTTKQDAEHAIATGQTLIQSLPTVNNRMTHAGLPHISYRVSMSRGPVSAMLDNAGSIIDLFGATINTCSKMNKMAEPESFIIGETLHTMLGNESLGSRIGEFHINDQISFEVFKIPTA